MNTYEIARKLRELRGNTPREQVALACNVTANAICNYESALRVPNDEVKIALANYYGKTVQEIFYS